MHAARRTSSFGESMIREGIQRAGYSRIINTVYEVPRGMVYLDLYARPGADLGTPISGIPPFTESAAWGIPPGRSPVQASSDGRSVTITNQSSLGTAVVTQLKTGGDALYAADLDVETRLPGSRALVTLACLTQAGSVLHQQTASTPEVAIGGVLHHQSAIVCPRNTSQLRITLRNQGVGEMTFTNLGVRKIEIPARP